MPRQLGVGDELSVEVVEVFTSLYAAWSFPREEASLVERPLGHTFVWTLTPEGALPSSGGDVPWFHSRSGGWSKEKSIALCAAGWSP